MEKIFSEACRGWKWGELAGTFESIKYKIIYNIIVIIN